MTTPMFVPHPQAVDQQRKSMSLGRKAWPFAQALLLLAMAWRWVLIPTVGLLIVLTSAAAAHPLVLVLVVGLLLGSVSGVSGLYRARLSAAAARSRLILWRLYWPYLCSFCQFVEVGNRRPRVATLVRLEFGPGNWIRPDWVRLVVEPCTTHGPNLWDGYEQRIRRHLRYRSSSWVPDEDNPNRMVITCRRQPLPKLVPVGGPDLLAADFLPTADGVDGFKPVDEVLLGVGADGDRVVWRPDESGRAMLFIAGRQGGGKGITATLIFLYGLLTQQVRECGQWTIRVCDPKGMGEFNWLQRHGVEVAKDPASMFAMISEFRAEMEKRARILDRLGVANWLDVPAQTLAAEGIAGRVVLVLDEFVSLLAMKGAVPLVQAPVVEGQPKQRAIDPYQVMVGDLQALFAMGRALGMSLIPMTQHPIAEHMGPFGSTMKANLGARIGVGNLEPEGAGSLFGKSAGEAIAHLMRAGIPGRAVYQGLANADGGSWRQGQIAYAPTAALEQLMAQATTGPRARSTEGIE